MLFARILSRLALSTAAALLTPGLVHARADVEPSVWDLHLGAHAREIPSVSFANWACGTNGGPPSLRIAGWTDYARCPAERGTGLHEVYFEYDDEQEYIAHAQLDEAAAALYAHTSIYGRPVIASALFDADGFLRGLRVVTDPRVDLAGREIAYTLGGFLQARYDGAWECADLPKVEGETPYQGIYVKVRCVLEDAENRTTYTVETHLFRKPGELAINPVSNLPTSGDFESQTRFEEILTGDIEDRAARLAAVAALPPQAVDPVAVRAMDCPGCDLSEAELKRANLRGANLAGANLRGADFHAADLTDANLEGANLRGANLNRALLTRARLAGADMTSAMLYEARLDGARLKGAQLTDARAGRSRWVSADLTEAVVAEVDLTEARMSNVTAPRATFFNTRLWSAQMGRSDFSGADFTAASLVSAVMSDASLAGANFSRADLSGANLRGCDCAGANFAEALLKSAVFAGARLDGAQLQTATGFVPPLERRDN
jgi:uncharacterized protein YjbI with pentapeptide repeats